MPNFNAYNPYMQQPYMGQPYAQPQYQQQLYSPPMNQAPQMSGRVIQNESEIRPNEIPMDGSMSLFPNQDYSVIIAKKWTSDGTLQTFKFVPDKGDIPKQDPILQRLDRIEKLLNRPQKFRKEVDKHES